ncbi:MAG: DoxX family protein [Bdellovibrionaceae bacterium]|nr:DoxX family protein [Pseudobdellovibrionaceae bacterium]|tara:strand:- start:2413 stop:2853 length:441 start_codon:yes stop_codon:yes gene_type:complete
MLAKIQRFDDQIGSLLGKIYPVLPLLTRLILGYVFFTSGWGKFGDLQGVTQYFESIGIPAASIQAPFVAGLELIGGTCIALGVFTRIFSILLIGVMKVAIWTAILGDLSSYTDLLSTSEFLYIILFAWLTFQGPGPISIERNLLKR